MSSTCGSSRSGFGVSRSSSAVRCSQARKPDRSVGESVRCPSTSFTVGGQSDLRSGACVLRPRAQRSRDGPRMPEPHESPLARELRDDALERFVRYARIDTQADRHSTSYPSTLKQLDLSRLLVDELHALAIADATSPSTATCSRRCRASTRARRSACVAHVDVSPDAPGDGRRAAGAPRATTAASSSPGSRPRRARCSPSGSGTTSSPRTGRRCSAPTTRPASRRSWPRSPGSSPIPRCRARRARIAFTVDEEVGRGVDHFDLEAFGADFAYTLDGSVVGEIENETWSAVELKVTFHGVGVHPGTAKGKLVNPIKAAARFVASLPARHAVARDDRGARGVRAPARDRGRRRRR